MECPKCKAENAEGKRFCRKCGTPLSLTCVRCGAVVSPDDDFCGECGHKAHAGPQEGRRIPELEGERKHVTILFSDITGYTALSQELDPEELRQLTAALFAQITKVIERYGGFVEKYIGDAVMAVFGVPLAHEDDPERAIRAAREIHRIVADEKTVPPLSMHTGINTGLVVAGVVDEGRGTHGIAGDTVNIASRLCGLARSGEIVAGAETWKQAEGYFDFEELPSTPVKGKMEPLRLFKVLSPKEKPLMVHGLSGIMAHLTGRDAEMAELREVAEKLARGEGTIVSVCGDAGTGKSRLIEEFRTTLDLSRIQWFASHAHPYAQNTPYSLVTDLLSRVFEIDEGDTRDRVKEKLETHIRSLTGDGTNIIPSLGRLYSLPYPALDSVTPEHWKSLLRKAFAETLSALAQRSTVIVMDDLQWADPSSLEVLRAFLTDVSLPSLILVAYRPEFSLFTGDQAASLRRTYHEIRLHDLSSSESLQMLCSLLGASEAPRELQHFFHERIQGNPFYLEEVVNGLIDSGTLAREGGTWRLTRSLNEAEISSGIHGVIEGRLDRLEKETKSVLQEASVIGRSFLFEILHRITALTEQCEVRVARLEQLDFIRTKTLEPDLEYVFKHALTQEVVYKGLLKKNRREIHERIARVMEALLQTRLPEFYEILAYHYVRGESSAKAIEYLIKSGGKSLARYAVTEAYQSYEQAYALISAKRERTKQDSAILTDVLINWAVAFYYLGEFGRLEALLALHEEEVATLGDDERTSMFCAWIGWAHFWTGTPKIAHGYLTKAREIAQRVGDQRALGYACTFLSYTAGAMALFEEGLDAGRAALAIGKAIPSDHYLSFKGLCGIAFIHLMMGDLRSALAEGKALLDYGREQSNHRSLVLGNTVIAIAHFSEGDMASAVEWSRKAIEAARDPLYAQLPRPYLAAALLAAGALDEAEKEIMIVLDFDERYNVGWLAGLANLLLALVRIARGHVGEGLKALEAVKADLLANGYVFFHLSAEHAHGTVYLRMVEGGDSMGLITLAKNLPFLVTNLPFADSKARKHLEEAVRLAESIQARVQLAQTLLSLGLLHRAKNRTLKALEALSEAARLFEECEADAYLRQAREAIDSLAVPADVPGGTKT